MKAIEPQQGAGPTEWGVALRSLASSVAVSIATYACHPKAEVQVLAHAACNNEQSAVVWSSPFPDTWDKTRTFIDWPQADLTEGEIQRNASEYTLVWSGPDPTWDLFRKANPSIQVGRYMLAFTDDTSRTMYEIDTPEQRVRNLNWWNESVDGIGHPDWVMYQCDGRTPAYSINPMRPGETEPQIPLDITNPDVIQWQFQTVAGQDWEREYTAISADMLDLWNFNHACGVYRRGEWVQLFSGEEEDPVFASAVINWARQMRARSHSMPSPKLLLGNAAPTFGYKGGDIAELAAHLDGVVDEQSFTGYGTGRWFITDDVWLDKIHKMSEIQALGTAFFSHNTVDMFPPAPDELEWILASFLMGRERSAYLLITRVGAQGVRWPHLPAYDEDLGHPCGPMQASNGVYVRDFSKGMVVVNPSASDSYLSVLPRGMLFRDIHGQLFGANGAPVLELPPATGKVLISLTNKPR